MTNLYKTNKLFRAFSDQTRLRILNLLTQGELCVCEIFRILNLPQPKVSRHLAYLRKTSLVKTRRNGQMILYSLTKPKDDIRTTLIKCLKYCFKKDKLLQADLKKIIKEIRK